VETSGNMTNADRRFVWCGPDICEEDNSSGAVVNRYFSQGEQQNGVNFFYTRDHLGSVRELTDMTSALGAEYGYEPYGLSSKLAGTHEANFGFANQFRHLPSALGLAEFRAYNPAEGRWLSRDPISESGGLNLYAYVFDAPVNAIDFLGLQPSVGDQEIRSGTHLETCGAVGAFGVGFLAAAGVITGGTAIPLGLAFGFVSATGAVAVSIGTEHNLHPCACSQSPVNWNAWGGPYIPNYTTPNDWQGPVPQCPSYPSPHFGYR